MSFKKHAKNVFCILSVSHAIFRRGLWHTQSEVFLVVVVVFTTIHKSHVIMTAV